jgi:hypothetical protein
MALSPAEELLIARDVLRGLEADIIRAELLDEARLDTLKAQKKATEKRIPALEKKVAAEEKKIRAAAEKERKAAEKADRDEQAAFERRVQEEVDRRVAEIQAAQEEQS